MFVFQMADIMPALPEIFLAAVALVLVLVAAYGGGTAARGRAARRLGATARHCVGEGMPPDGRAVASPRCDG